MRSRSWPGKGALPAEHVIKEHYRLGSTCAILSRSFCNANIIEDKEEIKRVFDEGMKEIRALEAECVEHQKFFAENEVLVAGVLSLYKCQRFFAEKQKEHEWEKKRELKELGGQKVCILGCGSVGVECAKRFGAFGCMVWGIDTRVREHENFFCVYHLDDVKEVLSKSDIVIIALPLTDETYHMFDKEMFAAMKSGAVMVNIARGALVC